MRRLVAANIVLGEPLPFSIYDEKGNLLLRKGFTVTMPDQVDRLLARKALVDDEEWDEAPPASRRAPPEAASRPIRIEREPVFERINGLVLNLKHIIATALKSPEQIELPSRIGKLAVALQECCREDMDGALAAPCLDFRNPYIIVHQIMGAVLAEIMASRKGLPEGQRLSLVCAALTRDWGQFPIHNELERHSGPLPEALLEQLKEHPARSMKMLEAAGVCDPFWLAAVYGHHERLDGSGYPRGLQGDAVPLGARVLAIADAYSAMCKPRPYRAKAHTPQQALREIYLGIDSRMDGELTNLLIREIGMLPPATLVRLKCGEIAVIKSPTQKPAGAQVYSIYGKSGTALSLPVLRDTGLPDFEITGMVSLEECKSAALTIKRVWLGSH